MKLKEMIFTDGQVLSYHKYLDAIILEFLDYSNNKIEITFQGDVEYQDNDGIQIEFSDSTLSENQNKQILQLFDDEKTCLFQISFRESEIRFI